VRLAELLDSRFRIPGTGIRFGLDPIIGLIPVVGDTVTLAAGAAIVLEARRLGLPRAVLLRMLGNLGIDWLVGLVPLADLVLDTAFRANVRNVRLLEAALRERAG
jgi:hypothetical protein